MTNPRDGLTRRSWLTASATVTAAAMGSTLTTTSTVAAAASPIVEPPTGKRILLSCKLGMITKKEGDRELTIVERLNLAKDAGFDGVDFDEAGRFTAEEARAAVAESGVFVHNAINHAHWAQRLTSADPKERETGRNNIAHCLRVSHAAGGSGVLIVIGRGDDGSPQECDDRAFVEIESLIPLAASLGQKILFENVWNKMHYDHDAPPEQTPERFIQFVDRFRSPWVGMYYDIGNHWKYGQPRAWLQAFGPRTVKLDVKGFSRAKNKFVDITSPEDDLPWKEVQEGLKEIGFTGWATAEVGGGGLERLTTIRKQMEQAFGLA